MFFGSISLVFLHFLFIYSHFGRFEYNGLKFCKKNTEKNTENTEKYRYRNTETDTDNFGILYDTAIPINTEKYRKFRYFIWDTAIPKIPKISVFYMIPTRYFFRYFRQYRPPVYRTCGIPFHPYPHQPHFNQFPT